MIFIAKGIFEERDRNSAMIYLTLNSRLQLKPKTEESKLVVTTPSRYRRLIKEEQAILEQALKTTPSEVGEIHTKEAGKVRCCSCRCFLPTFDINNNSQTPQSHALEDHVQNVQTLESHNGILQNP